ncbi:heat shock protein beta-7-like [Pseudoliparis swirei]|uniref:heat shock protein beta-7-like n=1 Tax=Pseudoliparis swirei TaxID=2059687 RepID=UPI0024BDC24D|nr:heat shock protein beta-7-like [Pseudoliparis swirei]
MAKERTLPTLLTHNAPGRSKNPPPRTPARRERDIVWPSRFFPCFSSFLSLFVLRRQSGDIVKMASLTSSSRRSSSSYRSSSRFSTSSSFRSEGSLGGRSDSLGHIFEPFLDSADGSGVFGEESPAEPGGLTPFSRQSRSSYGLAAPVGGAVTGAGVRCFGDTYYVSADVGHFEPHDIVVMAFNHQVVIHGEKVLDDGSVSDTFTLRSQLPEDMDPLSVGGALQPGGSLLVSVRRAAGPEPPGGPQPPGGPAHTGDARL